MNIPTLQTSNLFLRPWSAEDEDAWFNIMQEEGILRYFPDQTPPVKEKAKLYIAHQSAHWQLRGYGHWAVVNRQDGNVLGWSGLEYLPELDETEVAYLLSKKVWGHGLATEAARASIRFGFESTGLEKIIGLVHPENLGSVHVLEKCGLTFVDQIPLWGLEMSRYRITRATYEENLNQN